MAAFWVLEALGSIYRYFSAYLLGCFNHARFYANISAGHKALYGVILPHILGFRLILLPVPP
jgi:hypothetical protein